MPNTLNLTIDFLSYNSQIVTNDPNDAIKIINTIQGDSISKDSRQQIVLPATGSPQTIPLPDTNANYLLIFSDQPLSMLLNGSVTAFTLSPQAAGLKCPVFYYRGTISSLQLSVPGATAANVDILLLTN